MSARKVSKKKRRSCGAAELRQRSIKRELIELAAEKRAADEEVQQLRKAFLSVEARLRTAELRSAHYQGEARAWEARCINFTTNEWQRIAETWEALFMRLNSSSPTAASAPAESKAPDSSS